MRNIGFHNIIFLPICGNNTSFFPKVFYFKSFQFNRVEKQPQRVEKQNTSIPQRYTNRMRGGQRTGEYEERNTKQHSMSRRFLWKADRPRLFLYPSEGSRMAMSMSMRKHSECNGKQSAGSFHSWLRVWDQTKTITGRSDRATVRQVGCGSIRIWWQTASATLDISMRLRDGKDPVRQSGEMERCAELRLSPKGTCGES